ncbi:MAG: NAD(P)-dependent glycerol-3-phosphate dehydrogenase [Rhodospirillaceae bacterium]|nr:NAD(P)-dependent glycerol-3-phosphate dehydrogenase [Rhodospirillaceae bacterium]MDD9917964.1 NAD(P)-dependent glycerol-3-phosphate dehydrogenase [Rhodospirillaceae bacterium]MDD9929270.1 NAD(P)-dependent glycerol-3-phosphate dehydrogenase [Rhodospirillaceae bacterium]
MTRVAIIGGGAWGTALACVARRAGNDTTLWARNETVVAAINAGEGNRLYLKDVPLEPGIAATSDLEQASADADIALLVVPSQFVRDVSTRMAPAIKPGTPIALCAKGVEQTTGALMSEVLVGTVPQAKIAVLSGPTFAQEVARDLPTAVTLASSDSAAGERLAAAIGGPHFRPYLSDDPVGAEIGGAVKNVLAIACGIVAGRRMGDNARAALITRGLAEIVRLGLAKGARAETLMGLSGLGDLTLTCNAMQSRNFSLGAALGEGRQLDDILEERNAVTEGVFSAGSVTALAERLGIEMPICQAVNRIVNHGDPIDQVIAGLLSRPFAREQAHSD